MKYLKMLGLAVLSAMALTAFVGAGPASATTLEVTTSPKNESVFITATLKSESSAILESTLGVGANTCTGSHVEGATTSPYTETTYVTGHITTLSFSGCQHSVTVHKVGGLKVDHIPGTTNGTVYSYGAEVTVYSTIHGTYVNCKTGDAGVHIGTLTGSAHGHATLDVNAVLDCGGEHLSSARWTATYEVTTPTGLGVVA